MSPPKPFPVPDLDDRRFDELVAELQARLARHVPELAPLAPGDPVFALVDLFAWLTETILYRANRIPDRQRQAFLNLLQIPLRPARPASGIVSVDASGFALPLPIPFSNTVPAIVIFIHSLGRLERNGALLLLSYLIFGLCLGFFVVLILERLTTLM